MNESDANADEQGRQQATELLTALWGADDDGNLEGTHFVATPSRVHDGFDHFTVSAIAGAVDKVLSLSRDGRNAYFACAEYLADSYIDDKGKTRQRTGDNAKGAWSLWLDMDCGKIKAEEGKGYTTKGKAFTVLAAFCKAVGLPLPSIIVDSGNGLHCYWQFTEFINRAAWRELAGKLKALAAKHGLLADPCRPCHVGLAPIPPPLHHCAPREKAPQALAVRRRLVQWQPLSPAPVQQFAVLSRCAGICGGL